MQFIGLLNVVVTPGVLQTAQLGGVLNVELYRFNKYRLPLKLQR